MRTPPNHNCAQQCMAFMFPPGTVAWTQRFPRPCLWSNLSMTIMGDQFRWFLIPSGLETGLDGRRLPPWKFASQTILLPSRTSSPLLSFVTATIPTAGIALNHLVQQFGLNQRHLWRKDGGVEKQKHSRTRPCLIPKHFGKEDLHIPRPRFDNRGGDISQPILPLQACSGLDTDWRKICKPSTPHEHDQPGMKATHTGNIHVGS